MAKKSSPQKHGEERNEKRRRNETSQHLFLSTSCLIPLIAVLSLLVIVPSFNSVHGQDSQQNSDPYNADRYSNYRGPYNYDQFREARRRNDENYYYSDRPGRQLESDSLPPQEPNPVNNTKNDKISCYDYKMKAQRCVPGFVNAAYGRRVEVTNTCGERQPTLYCLQTGPSFEIVHTRTCSYCDTRNESLAHPPDYLTGMKLI